MQVQSTKTIHFPKFNWGIHAGETRELPQDESAQKEILKNSAISRADGKTKSPNAETSKDETATKPEVSKSGKKD